MLPCLLSARTTHQGTYLKLQRRSWQWSNSSLAITLAREFNFCGQTTAPGYCTCRGPLHWRAVKAGEESCWLGNLIFAGVINRILVLTLAGEFSNILLLRTGLLVTKCEKSLQFCVESEKLLLFCVEKWKINTFSHRKETNIYLFVK